MVHHSVEISYVMKRVVNLMIYHFQFATNDPLMFAGMLTTLSDGLLIVPRTVQVFPMMGWIVSNLFILLGDATQTVFHPNIYSPMIHFPILAP